MVNWIQTSLEKVRVPQVIMPKTYFYFSGGSTWDAPVILMDWGTRDRVLIYSMQTQVYKAYFLVFVHVFYCPV